MPHQRGALAHSQNHLEVILAVTDPVLRDPRIEDAPAIRQLALDTATLDVNSPYAYALACAHHGKTCVVADTDAELAGFVIGYRIPDRTDSYFVWQVAVDDRWRGRGVAGRMVEHVLGKPPPAQYLEASVTPSNTASARLFESVAQRHDARCETTKLFSGELLGNGHEDENLLRIGPFGR